MKLSQRWQSLQLPRMGDLYSPFQHDVIIHHNSVGMGSFDVPLSVWNKALIVVTMVIQ